MNFNLSKLRSRLLSRESLWRFIWLSVLVLHAPATLRVFSLAFSAESKWSGILLIAATNAFFILEILFGWSLRILTDRRRIVAFVLIIALLHVGIIDHAIPSGSVDGSWNVWIALSIGPSLLLRRCMAFVRVLFADVTSLVIRTEWVLRLLSRRRTALARAPAHARRFLMPARPHRAPPL